MCRDPVRRHEQEYYMRFMAKFNREQYHGMLSRAAKIDALLLVDGTNSMQWVIDIIMQDIKGRILKFFE